jgi:hypothetical protein
MDSPYRTANLDVILSASRLDKRCGPYFGAICPRRGATPLLRSRFAKSMTSLLIAVVFTGAAVAAIGGGVRACITLGSINPQPVLLRCATAATPSPPSPPPRIAPLRPLRQVPFDLPTLPVGTLQVTEPVTHDPWVLRERAHDLEKAGFPLRVIEVALPAWETPKIEPFQIHATPVTNGPASTEGIEISYVPKYSLLARAGFRQGDVVLSIDGYPAAGTEWTDHVFLNSDRGGRAVVELVRDRQRVVLVLAWPASPRG